jgi:flagellin-like protein
MKLVKGKKAISPILATLLLIVIAVAAIVVTYAWIMTYMGSAGHQAGIMLYKENIRFYDDAGIKKIEITIRNSGTSDARWSAVYAGLSTTNLVNQTTTAPSLPLAVVAGGSQLVTINHNWTAGALYYFKVVSEQVIEIGPEQAPVS